MSHKTVVKKVKFWVWIKMVVTWAVMDIIRQIGEGKILHFFLDIIGLPYACNYYKACLSQSTIHHFY